MAVDRRPRSKPATGRHTHDIKVMSGSLGVNAPKQARSERRLQMIVHALESLLAQRTFEEITIADIGAEAGCGSGSIYARFKDKKSILVALHESMRDRQISRLDHEISRERRGDRPIEPFVEDVCRHLIGFYTNNHNLLRANYLIDNNEIYRRAASAIGHASELMAQALDCPPDIEQSAFDERVDLGMRAIYALLQQRMVFRPSSAGHFPAEDDDGLARKLTGLFLAVIRAG